MPKLHIRFLLLILILLPSWGLGQNEYFTLELHYSSGLCQGFPGSVLISVERKWNLEFNNDSVVFEGIKYKIQDNDTLLLHYLSEMKFIMQNNDFLYNDYWLDVRDNKVDYLYVDGTETIGIITSGQEAEMFNVISHYEYDAVHQNFFNCFFNIAFYLLTETPVCRQLEYITYWQLSEFEKNNNNIFVNPYRKVSDSPLHYRFYSDTYYPDWDTAIMNICQSGKPAIFEVEDCFRIPSNSEYFKDKSHITWQVYSQEMRKNLLKKGIRKDCIKFMKYPKMGSYKIPEEAIIMDFNDMYEIRTSKSGRSASKE